jgi:hypothetical protein
VPIVRKAMMHMQAGGTCCEDAKAAAAPLLLEGMRGGSLPLQLAHLLTPAAPCQVLVLARRCHGLPPACVLLLPPLLLLRGCC